MRFVLGALLLLLAGAAAADNPMETERTHEVRGDTIVVDGVSCTTAGTVTALSTTDDDNLWSVVLKNNDASNAVMICTATPCDSGTATNGFTVAAGGALILNTAPIGTLYCDGIGGTVVLQRTLEKR